MSSVMQHDVSLSAHTTLQVGGPADYFVAVHTVEGLKQALHFAKQNAVPVYVLGGGSNILFPDDGFRGLVIKNCIPGIVYTQQESDTTLVCGAGENWDDVVADTVEKKYWGLENLSLIPGTVGATPIQNVGAYGVEVAELITAVACVHKETLQEKVFSAAECQFGYRDSYFKSTAGRDWIVTHVTFTVSASPQPKLEYKDIMHLQGVENISSQIIRDAIVQVRTKKFPDWERVGTAGSFFKNPIIPEAASVALVQKYPELPTFPAGPGECKVLLGWILDKALHLKGYKKDNVRLFENQALVLVNEGGSSQAIESFYLSIQKIVFEETGITIEPEVQIVKNK